MNRTNDAPRPCHGEVQQPETRRPAGRDVAGGRRVPLLPAIVGPGDGHERLAREVDPRRGGQGLDMMLGGVKIRGRARPPAAHGIVGDHEGDRGALEILAVELDEDPAGLANPGHRPSARLVEAEGFEQAHDQRGAQMRLVLGKGIRQRELLGGRLRDPGRGLLRRAQGGGHALVEVVADEIGGDRAIEAHHRIVLARQPRCDHPGGRDFLRAMDPQDLLHQVDRPVEIVAPGGDGHRPGKAGPGRRLLADDGELERFERRLHVGVGNDKAQALGHESRGDGDLAPGRQAAADLVHRPGNASSPRLEDEVEGPPRRFLRRLRIDPALVAIG